MEAADVCRVLLRLAATTGAPAVVLVCTGIETTVRDLAERAFREHGLDPALIEEAPPRPHDAPYLVGVPTVF
jgi:nucleoside-diphosphate-sugar epimerase